MSKRKLLNKVMILILGVGLCCICNLNTYAVGTAYWEIKDKPAARQGEMENLVITADGTVVLGETVVKMEVPVSPTGTYEPSIWTGVKGKKDIYYFGSGSGKTYKMDGEKLDIVYDTKELLVTSLAFSDSGELFVATIPNGKIFKIGKDEKGELFSTLPSTYVWSLLFGPNGKLYAATGQEGIIYEIDSKGTPTIFYDTKKKANILSMVFDGKDAFYFGTSNPGILYRISLKGKPEVISDFGPNEIKHLYFSNQTLYIAVNSGIQVPPQEFLEAMANAANQPQKIKEKTPQQPPQTPQPAPQEESTKPQEKDTDEDSEPAEKEGDNDIQPCAPPASSEPKAPVQSYIYKLNGGGVLKEIITFDNCYLTEIKANDRNEIFAGTDNTGKVFKINEQGEYSIPFDFETKQVLTLLLDKDGNLNLIGTGGQGRIYQVSHKGAKDGSYTSEAFDAKFVSKWGNFTWKGTGKLAFQSRSGNTNKPDETWSDWSKEKVISPEEPFMPENKEGRYFQFKLTWETDNKAELKQTCLAYLINNQKPKLSALAFAADQAQPQPPQPPQPGQPQMPIVRNTMKTVTWQALDTEGEHLGYKVFYKKEGLKYWIPMHTETLIFTNAFMWDTGSLADGEYRVKVIVTDEKSNSPEAALSDEKISNTFRIDNTAPQVTVKIAKETCSGKIMDQLSPIRKIQYALDGKEWNQLMPKDGLLDTKEEGFEFSLAKLDKGMHSVTIMGFDDAGNFGTATEEFEIK
ncbi:MAG: WD40 repeat domain-containing protein [Planctomycetes bacterium]|nr:WD40 repeat domain-containing protein [Planctomycetota bacterium]